MMEPSPADRVRPGRDALGPRATAGPPISDLSLKLENIVLFRYFEYWTIGRGAPAMSGGRALPPDPAPPPGPKGRGLGGNMRDFRGDRLGFLAENARRYGDVVAL